MKSISPEKLLWYFVLFLGVMLCIRELREPDLWWQLRTGEWMLENKTVTFKDVFSYTNAGVDWINVKWGYEIIIAWISKFLGPEGVMFLNMVSVTLILFFLKKNHSILRKEYTKKSIVIIAICGILFLILHNARINGRPEMTTYTLTAVYLYLFSKYRNSGSKLIYLLIPLQVFWTNMHEAYGVGVVMIIIFIVGNILERYLCKKGFIPEWKHKVLPLLLVGILSILGILINPNGTELFDHYIEIYTQLQENKFTTENFSFKTKEYWNYVAYLNLGLFILTFKTLFLFDKEKKWNNAVALNILLFLFTLFLFIKGYWYYVVVINLLLLLFSITKLFYLKKGIKIKDKILSAINKWGLVYLLLYLAFFYLSLQAVRNTYFFAIVSLPILAIYLEEKVFIKSEVVKFAKIGLAFCLVLYLSIGSGLFYKVFSPREQYGLKISSKRTPLGAAKFLKENKIEGKGFVDYLNSSYLLWSMQPNFKTYIDLRDLDIFPQTFMENVFIAYENPTIPLESGATLWEAMVGADSFNYIVMSNNEQFATFNNNLIYNDPNYELVFADGVTSVFLSAKYQSLVDSLGYKNGNRDIFQNFTESYTNGFAKAATKVFWPFYSEHQVSDKEERLTRQAYYRSIN